MSISLVWKEAGLGSQQKLAQVKRELSTEAIRDRKGIGHCGTLDPFAEGILCVGIGEGTKLLSALVGLSKTYIVEMILGATSETFDSESPFEFASDLESLQKLDDDKVIAFLASKIGPFEQIPPQHSAVKVGGKRAFEYARDGKNIELKPRPVEIFSAKHISLKPLIIEGHVALVWNFEVSVSSGTYIRSLARDWAQELVGFAGTLKSLVRSKLGPWQMDGSQPRIDLGVEDFAALIPKVDVSSEKAQGLKSFGRWDRLWLAQESPREGVRGYLLVDPTEPDSPVALLNPDFGVQRVFTSDPFV